MPEEDETDQDAFMRQLLKHQGALLRFIYPLVGNRQDAEDVLQRTAVALWNKFDDYDPSRPFFTWARSFARLEVLMHHRKENRYVAFSPELIESLIERQEERLDDGERAEALNHCLAKLSPRDRELLQIRYFEKKTIAEAAEGLGRSADAIYQALTRLRRQLRECVNQTLARTNP